MLLSTQGPFPPPALPGFSGTTDPSATLTARPAPRGVPVDVCRISPRASRVAAFFPFHACQRHYPDGSGSVPASLSSPSANGLPLKTGGSASVLSVSRPARRSLAFRPACSLSRPWRPLTPECFRPFRYLHDPPWLLPTGATVVGRGSHPPEEGAFPRRTALSGFNRRRGFDVLPSILVLHGYTGWTGSTGSPDSPSRKSCLSYLSMFLSILPASAGTPPRTAGNSAMPFVPVSRPPAPEKPPRPRRRLPFDFQGALP